jgi:hypothetical protein
MTRKPPRKPPESKLKLFGHITHDQPATLQNVLELTEAQHRDINNLTIMQVHLGKAAGHPLKIADSLALLILMKKVLQRPLNPQEAERLGKLLVAADAVVPKPSPAGIVPSNDLATILESIQRLEAKLTAAPKEALANEVEWVSIQDFAKLIERAEWTVAENYCKTGKVICRKLDPMNPRSAWRILKSEAKRFKEEGFRKIVQDPNDS